MNSDEPETNCPKDSASIDFDRLNRIFFPDLLSRKSEMERMGSKFVQYTSAQNAMSIIQNSEVWLRNCLCMNDVSEINHGLECLAEAYNDEATGAAFRSAFESVIPDSIDSFQDEFNSWQDSIRLDTYIACLSEHLRTDIHGRLSMWRAYGPKNGVAIVIDPSAVLTDTNAFKSYMSPVLYVDSKGFKDHFSDLAERIRSEAEFLKELPKDTVSFLLFELFKTYSYCTKHPGFEEEREWRIVHCPKMQSSEYVTNSVEVIDGVTQRIYKIPLRDIPEEGVSGLSIPSLIDEIIIGPSNDEIVLRRAFVDLLESAGCEDANSKVNYSGIPYRP